METITLNDGTVLDEGYIIPTINGILFYFKRVMTLLEACELFSDPDVTERITALKYGETTAYEGYTELTSIGISQYQINGVLKKAN